MDNKTELEDVCGLKRMTKKVIRYLCKKNNLYMTPHLNDVLYLHFQGFQRIECLEEYTGLRCLWLESNAISEICGLENQRELRCLFLQNNLVKEIENLDSCIDLDTLNLSHNQITEIKNCGSDVLPVLNTLNLSHNYLKSAAQLKNLRDCHMLSILDLSHNRLDDILIVKVLAAMPELHVLVLTGNPVVSLIPSYRKTMILECLKLTYLDSRPISDKERACVVAWQAGGIEGERKENARWNREERLKIIRSVNATIRMRNRAGGEPISELIEVDSDDEKGLVKTEEEVSNIQAWTDIESQAKQEHHPSYCEPTLGNTMTNRKTDPEFDPLKDMDVIPSLSDKNESEDNIHQKSVDAEIQPIPKRLIEVIGGDPDTIDDFGEATLEKISNDEDNYEDVIEQETVEVEIQPAQNRLIEVIEEDPDTIVNETCDELGDPNLEENWDDPDKSEDAIYQRTIEVEIQPTPKRMIEVIEENSETNMIEICDDLGYPTLENKSYDEDKSEDDCVMEGFVELFEPPTPKSSEFSDDDVDFESQLIDQGIIEDKPLLQLPSLNNLSEFKDRVTDLIARDRALRESFNTTVDDLNFKLQNMMNDFDKIEKKIQDVDAIVESVKDSIEVRSDQEMPGQLNLDHTSSMREDTPIQFHSIESFDEEQIIEDFESSQETYLFVERMLHSLVYDDEGVMKLAEQQNEDQPNLNDVRIDGVQDQSNYNDQSESGYNGSRDIISESQLFDQIRNHDPNLNDSHQPSIDMDALELSLEHSEMFVPSFEMDISDVADVNRHDETDFDFFQEILKRNLNGTCAESENIEIEESIPVLNFEDYSVEKTKEI